METSMTHLRPLAQVVARTLPDLWSPHPSETPDEAAARQDAALHILDDLLNEIAAELEEAAHER